MGNIDLNNLFESLPPPEYAALFCQQMRRQETIETAVSTRQAIAITRLLLATCFRKGTTALIPQDYIRAAVITTDSEHQDTAEEVALNILFPRLKTVVEEPPSRQRARKGKQGPPTKAAKPEIPEQFEKGVPADVLEGLVDFLSEVGSDFTSEGSQSTEGTGQPKDETTDEMDFFFLANSQWRAGNQPYKSLVETLDSPTEILLRKIPNLQQLIEHVKQQLLASVDHLTSAELAAIPHSDIAQQILQHTRNPVEKAVALHTSKQHSKFRSLSQQMLSSNPVDYTRMARALSDAGSITPEKYHQFVEAAAKQAQTSSEIYNVIKSARTMTAGIKEILFNLISKESSLVTALEVVSSLERLPTVSEPLVVDFLKQVLASSELETKLSFRTLPYIPYYSKDIEQAVARSFQKELSKLMGAKRPKELKALYEEITDIREQTQNPYYVKMMKILHNQAANSWLQSITDRQTFLNTGHQLARQGVEF
ncbi:MAG: hypothetical protein ACFFCO_04470, partial [Promethearchaeota archaeon]